MTRKQKFQRGDRVRIAADLGSSMRHFPADQDALVLYSYHNMFGLDDRDSWCLYLFKSGGNCSWYHTNQLTAIKGAHGMKLADKLNPRQGWQRLIAVRPWQD